MIDVSDYFWIALVLIILGQALSFIIVSKRFWAATDYLWYALAAISVGLFVADFNDRLKQETISKQLSEVEKQTTATIMYFEQVKARAECQMRDSYCGQVSMVVANLTEFQGSANWPSGSFEDNLEVNYPSLPAYLTQVSAELLESSPGSFQALPEVIDTLTIAIADFEQLQERETWKVHVLIMRFAVYLLAVGIALKIGKVTWTLRQLD
jgi:hypothetical protein